MSRGLPPGGGVDLGDVARHHHLEPTGPIRVRTISSARWYVFWAFVVITKASFKVRPGMNAIGATSIALRSKRRRRPSRSRGGRRARRRAAER